MATTSLVEQLQKLSVPQSKVYKDDKKKASLLFDPKEAALKDRDTFYEIGISGLNELIALYEGFRIYEDTLFSLSSKEFERAVQSKEVNENLDATLEKFLLQLSPYLLLQSSHKALEWLVNRYHIHEYNQDAIMALILPYHETKIFVRFVQLFFLSSASNKWHWLKPLQKSGVYLGRQVLHNHCVSNPATLKFIAKMTDKHVKEFGERASQLNTVYAFFCTTAIGTIKAANKVSETLINTILPTLIKAIESPVLDYRSSAYVILGYLNSKTKLKEDTVHDIISRVLTTDFDLSYDVILLINLIFTHQTHISKISKAILYDISASTLNTLCEHLKKLVDQKINVLPFTTAFLTGVLDVIQKDNEDFTMFSHLPIILIEELDFKAQNPERIIKCIIKSLQSSSTIDEPGDDDSSDIEIVDEYSTKSLNWFSQLLKSLEQKYPDAFDKVVKQELSSKKHHYQLTKVLGFKPAVAHKLGGTYLFENLNHINPEQRIKAIKYIGKEYEKLKGEGTDFVKDSILNRLNDESIEVVSSTLTLPDVCFKETLNESDLASAFVSIVAKTSKKWKPVIKNAIIKFCALENFPVNQDTVLVIIPYLFDSDSSSSEMAKDIINSAWGKKFHLTKEVNVKKIKDFKELQQLTFDLIFNPKGQLSFDDILDINLLNKDNAIHVAMFLILKCSSLKRMNIVEIMDLLNLLIETVEVKTIVPTAQDEGLSVNSISEIMQILQQDKMVFQVLEHVFIRMIEDANVHNISKPWWDLCATPDAIFVRRLYEIFVTGCAIPSYSTYYTVLLSKLLNRYFDDTKEKIEFIANVACGHILYATDPKEVISPELQLRSLKLLNSYFEANANNTWLYDNDVIIVMILFDLNNPLTLIRECAINAIEVLMKNKPKTQNPYTQLMKELLTHKQELLLDHTQINQVLLTIFTQTDPSAKIFKKKCMQKIMRIFTGNTPSHVTSELLNILSDFNNTSVFQEIILTLSKLQETLKRNQLQTKYVLNIYESKLVKCVIHRINESTIAAFNEDKVWEIISFFLKEYRECIVEVDQTLISPAVLIMKQMNEGVFKKVPERKTAEMVKLMTFAGAFSNNPVISSAASKAIKKISIRFSDFKALLEGMLNVIDPAAKQAKKNKSSVSMLSHQVTETDEWKLGVSLLEYIQNKKKMIVDNSFVTMLFQILNRCLRFEEQSYVEYTKQLILSLLWYYCRKFVDETDQDQMKSLKLIFDIELVVQCIRGTQDPQTHHHALILLSHAAHMLPEQVLHHTMEIFTFMGSSVLRHDDAYSFQIITKIIETLIPILVKLDRNVEDYTESEFKQLKNRVVPVLRIFADVVLHVPEHRRLPLYKKLIETLGPNQFLWVLLGLLLEAHIAHFNENKNKEKHHQKKSLADQEASNRLDFGQHIILEFTPEIVLENLIQLVTFLKSLPLQKDESSMDTDVDPSDIFSVNGHTALQLRHYKYAIITFLNNCLSSSQFIHHSSQAKDMNTMEQHYKTFIINILIFIQSISKLSDEKTAKYWRVMLHHSYDLLDHTNNLLSAPMFLSVVRGLLKHTLHTVRRKSMELLNSKIQFSPEMFNNVDKELLYSIMPPLLDIVKSIGSKEENLSDIAQQELELNQQTALLSLKLLTRLLAAENPERFTNVLDIVTEYTCKPDIPDNVMASVVLCLAELCGNLKAHALGSLRKFMPALIKVLKKQRKAETPELVLLSTVTAISKIVESLPLFLSPYLQKILYEYSVLLSKWQSYDQECSKVTAIVAKLNHIKKKIASSIPPRILIPVTNETHRLLLEKECFDAIGPLMSVLADSFANITTADFSALQQDLTTFFLSALQLRSDASEKDVDSEILDKSEDEVVNALVCLVLKLSETSFRPFYFKIYDWAIRSNIGGQKDRVITFYRLSSAIADKLKGLFVLFAGHFIKNAAELLDACNKSKSEELYFNSEQKCMDLVHYIIKTLHIVFLYDSQNFINKERFETLLQPIVDQLENTLGGISSLKVRATKLIMPCISQFAVATGDDSLWKLLNYQVLLKTRHNDAEIRLIALECLVSMATQLGSSWLPLLAESVPFLAELLEDGDQRIEVATKDAIRKLEQILGEPLEKYF